MKKLFYIIAVCLVCAACKKVDDSLVAGLAVDDSYVAIPGAEYQIPFIVRSGTGEYSFRYSYNANIGKVEARMDETDPAMGFIVFSLAKELAEPQTSLSILVTNGSREEKFTLAFENEILSADGSADGVVLDFSASGGDSEIKLSTNTPYTFEIPNEARTWISKTDNMTKAVENRTLTISVKANDGFSRCAELVLRSNSGTVNYKYTVNQAGLEKTMKFVSSSSAVKLPVFSGNGLKAHLYWPGETQFEVMDPDKDYVREFADGSASHEVKVVALNAESFRFHELSGLVEIDITEFQ